MRRVVTSQRVQLSSQVGTLQCVEKCFGCGKFKRGIRKREVEALRLERNEIEFVEARGGFGCYAAVRATSGHIGGGGQMPPSRLVVSGDCFLLDFLIP